VSVILLRWPALSVDCHVVVHGANNDALNLSTRNARPAQCYILFSLPYLRTTPDPVIFCDLELVPGQPSNWFFFTHQLSTLAADISAANG